jgi:hypothetical protein
MEGQLFWIRNDNSNYRRFLNSSNWTLFELFVADLLNLNETSTSTFVSAWIMSPYLRQIPPAWKPQRCERHDNFMRGNWYARARTHTHTHVCISLLLFRINLWDVSLFPWHLFWRFFTGIRCLKMLISILLQRVVRMGCFKVVLLCSTWLFVYGYWQKSRHSRGPQHF